MAPRDTGPSDKLQLQLIGKKDKDGRLYYFTTTKLPVSVDLRKSVIFVFPHLDEDTGEAYAELIIKEHNPQQRRSDSQGPLRDEFWEDSGGNQ